jgi:chloramphenicol 3-O phosphotransferase
MEPAPVPGRIVVLNGAPRSGKSSIVRVVQETFDGPWMNLGVDIFIRATPPRFRPGMGLRPGNDRPDLQPLVPALFVAVYDSIAAHSRQGLHVIADVGHHDARGLGILADCAARLEGLPALFVGVRCPVEVNLQRRAADDPGGHGVAGAAGADEARAIVDRWEREVHTPGVYDLEVDTSELSPEECAALIRRRLDEGPEPSAFRTLAARRRD